MLFTGLASLAQRFRRSPQPIVTLNSQKGQDHWVIHDIFNGKREGFFLEMGAADGINLSNTLVLERDFGWNGICIEPNPKFFKTLQQNRQCICQNICADDEAGEVSFILAAEYGGIIDTDTDNNQDVRADALNDAHEAGRIVTCQARPLADILDECGAPPVIDYFSLDVEGAEERVLRHFPFDRYTFLTLTIERPTPLLNQILLEQNGYVFVKNVRSDTFYVHESIANFDQIKKLPFQQTGRKVA